MFLPADCFFRTQTSPSLEFLFLDGADEPQSNRVATDEITSFLGSCPPVSLASAMMGLYHPSIKTLTKNLIYIFMSLLDE